MNVRLRSLGILTAVLWAWLVAGDATVAAQATIAEFTVTVDAEGVAIHWETDAEPDVLGFHVLRATHPEALDVVDHGPVIRVFDYAQPPMGSDFNGARYTVRDPQPLRSGTTYYYWLEVMGLDSTLRYTGPLSAIWYAPERTDVFALPASAPVDVAVAESEPRSERQRAAPAQQPVVATAVTAPAADDAGGVVDDDPTRSVTTVTRWLALPLTWWSFRAGGGTIVAASALLVILTGAGLVGLRRLRNE